MNNYTDYIYSNYSQSIFPGFYNSILYDSDRESEEAEQLMRDTGKEYEVKDYQAMEKAICEDVTNALWNEAPDKICKDFKYKGMWSPKYYNNYTDRIEIKMKLNKKELYNFISHNRREFEYYVRTHCNSGRGFISFIPQSFEEWEENFKEGDEDDKPRAINTALDYLFLTEITETLHLDENTMYDIADSYYYDRLYEIANNRLLEYMEEK